MMRHCILACCVAATLSLVSWARGQEVGQPPAPEATMAAYRAVDGWVRDWSVGGGEVKAGEAPAPLCEAASVTLRLAGEVIGRGVEVAADDAGRTGVVAAATRAALKEAEPKLGVPRDAMYETTVKDVARGVTVSVQLAGAFIPIVPKDAAEAMAMVQPGVEGVAARLGGRIAANFPERMLTTGTEPGQALGTLVAKLADDPTLAVEPLSKLSKDKGAVLYRFRVVHLAQPKAGDTPVFLHRCGKVVPRGMMDVEELRRWADGLANNLIHRRAVGADRMGIQGALSPTTASLERPFADPTEQAVAALALLRYSKLPGLDEARASFVEAESDAIILDLATVQKGEEAPWLNAISAAAFCQAIGGGMGYIPSEKELITPFFDSQRRVAASWSPDGGFERSVPESARGLLLWTMIDATRVHVNYGTVEAAMAEPQYVAVRRSIMSQSNPGSMVSMMPWLGWCETTWTVVLDGTIKEPLSSAIALSEMRSQLWAHQLQPDALSPDQQDLAGGILFTSTRQPMPSWQMARPLAFIATMLGDPRLTEDKEVPEELSRLLLSLRFLRQLTAGEAEGFMYKNPDRALGGVRSSLWDQRMPPEATAMTLLTVCETLRSLDAIRARQSKKE